MKELSTKLSKRDYYILLITDVIFSIVFVIGKRINFLGYVWGIPEGEDYFRPFDVSVFLDFLICLVISGGILLAAAFLNRRYASGMTSDKKVNRKTAWILFIVSFIVLCVCWLPYIMSCLPGGIYSDTFSSIVQAYSMDETGWAGLNNHHPILYTLFIRAAIVVGRSVGKDLFFSMMLFTIVQYCLMAAELGYLNVWIYKRHGSFKVIVPIILFTALFPLFPLYAVSVWKDTPFCMVMLLLAMLMGEISFDRDWDKLKDPVFLTKLGVCSLLTIFTRNNGKYIIGLLFITLLIIRLKRSDRIRNMLVMMIIVAALTQFLQGYVFEKMNYNTDSYTESLAIPLQQICYVVNSEETISEEEAAYISTICPLEAIRENYDAFLFDAIKWSGDGINTDIIKNDPVRFMKVYLKLFIEHPVSYVKAYLLETSGYWSVSIASYDAYVQNNVWNNSYGLEKKDLFLAVTGIDFQNYVNRLPAMSSAIFFWIMIAAAVLLVMNRDYSRLLVLAGPFFCWFTVMIATPIACSLRYVYILVLVLPLEFALTATSKTDQEMM